MSISKSISEYFVKCKQNNWLVRAPQIKFTPLPNSSFTQKPVLEIPKSQIKKQNDSKLLEENNHLVGKGSNFERKSIQTQIKTLGIPNLKRVLSNQKQSYPEEEARFISHIENSRNNTRESSIHDQNNEENVKKIIETLIEITPKPEDATSVSPIALNDRENRKARTLRRHVYTEIPPLPDFDTDAGKFEDYIYTLTHSTFHYKNSSKFNGVISKILMNLFHPLNSNTSSLRSLDSYNSVLHYYSMKWNIATCRELMLQMKLEGISPNTTTYNLLLRNLLVLQHIQHMSNPYVIALNFLTQMKGREIKADVVTWNIIFGLLRDDFSKAVLLNNRSLLNIPLDNHSINTILKYLVEIKDVDSTSLLKLIHSYDFEIDRKLLCIIVKRLVKDEHYDSAFQIIELVKNDFDISSEPMNLLLTHYSNIGRIDIVISIMNTFKQKYDVKPDANTYNLVMKTFARSAKWNGHYKVWRVMYKQMLEDLDGIIAGDYWIKKVRAYYKFERKREVNLSIPLSTYENHLKELKNQLIIDDAIPINLANETESQKSYIKTAVKFGYGFKKKCKEISETNNNSIAKLKTLKTKNNSEEENLSIDIAIGKKRSKNYRKKINVLSIQKAMVKRIPYAKDPYGSLDKELRERNIIKTE